MIFSNLTSERVQKGLESETIPQANVEGISTFWREAFEILLFTPEVGCVVFHFEKVGETAQDSLVAKADMLAALGDVHVDEINMINVRTSDLSETGKTEATANAQMRLDEIVNSVSKKVKPSNSKHLMAKLIMLNRLQNQNVLLHEKLDE